MFYISPNRPDELFHFGVIGMKWGVRRYQNSDGTLTSAGKKRMKADFKEDNKKAFDLGKKATAYARASKYASKRESKLNKKAHKAINKGSVNGNSKVADYLAAKDARKQINKQYKKYEAQAKKFEKEMINKWGKENVSSIKYDKNGKVNEKVSTTSQKVGALVTNLASYTLSAAVGSPVVFYTVPYSKNDYGRDIARNAYKANRATYFANPRR